jgi:hypothetical protein
MCGGILERLDLIPCAGDDSTLVRNDRTNWHFSSRIRLMSLTQRLTHEIGIAVEINH